MSIIGSTPTRGTRDSLIENTVEASNFDLEVGKGNISGQRIIAIPGISVASLSSTQLSDISTIPNVVTLPNPGGIQLELVSSHANDNATGVGIQSIDIHYLDATTGLSMVELVVLNGTTPVNTVGTNFGNIQYIHARTLGSTGKAVGNISLRNTAGSVTYEYKVAGGNQSLSCRYTVPADETAFLRDWHAAGMKKRVDFYLRATCERNDRSLLPGIFLFQNVTMCEKTNSGILGPRGLKFPSLCEIKISGQADGAGGEAQGTFSLDLIKNTELI